MLSVISISGGFIQCWQYSTSHCVHEMLFSLSLLCSWVTWTFFCSLNSLAECIHSPPVWKCWGAHYLFIRVMLWTISSACHANLAQIRGHGTGQVTENRKLPITWYQSNQGWFIYFDRNLLTHNNYLQIIFKAIFEYFIILTVFESPAVYRRLPSPPYGKSLTIS